MKRAVLMTGWAAAGGPLGWLYPFEIQPLETRPAGGAVASLMNLLFSFVIGQPMLAPGLLVIIQYTQSISMTNAGG